MPKQEFLRVDQRPVHIFPRLAFIGGTIDVIEHRLHFAIARRTRETYQEQFVENLSVRKLLGKQLADAVVGIAQAVIDGGAVDELQSLREVAIPFALAFASQFSSGLAKGLEERVIDFAVR